MVEAIDEKKILMAQLNPKAIRVTTVIEVGKGIWDGYGPFPCVECYECVKIGPCVCVAGPCYAPCNDLPYTKIKDLEGNFAYRAVYEFSYELKESVAKGTHSVVEQKSRMILEMDKALEKPLMERPNVANALVKVGTLPNGVNQYVVKPSASSRKV